MSNIRTGAEIAADAAIEVAIASLLATFSTIKNNDQSPVMDRVAALRVLERRTIWKRVNNRVRVTAT